MIDKEKFGYVFATKMLEYGGMKVGFMYREKPDALKKYSGWCFFTGNESQAYCDNPDNIGIYSIETILKLDPSVEKYLDSEPGHAFERVGEEFREIDFDFDFE